MSFQRSIVCIVVSLLFYSSTSLSAFAAKAGISFIPNNDPLLFNYTIHYGIKSLNYTSEIDLIDPEVVDGNILAVVDDLQEGQTYYFAVTASDEYYTSELSNEMVYTVPSPEPSEFGVEVGDLSVTSEWQHVNFETPFVNPAVVAKAATTNNSEPFTVKIRNLSTTGFDIKIKEWDYLDGNHPAETVSYIAMEKGVHELEQNVQAVAACGNLPELNTFQTVAFTNPFSNTPVALASVVTDNGSNAVTLRLQNITDNNFQIKLQEEEASDGFHAGETYCYIAMSQWSGITNDLIIEAAVTGNTLNQIPATVSFTAGFPYTPFTLGNMQTHNGGDPAVLNLNQLSVNSVSMSIVEEQSADTEINHVNEVGGYIAISPLNHTDDNDNDGLSNSLELALGTNPNSADSDNDGINDGEEYQYWLASSSAPDADVDGDGIINILDSDSDNDGITDGVEIANGSDPAVDQASEAGMVMEVGELVISHEPVRINFSNSYTNPVIIANAVTRNGGDPSRVCIKDIDSAGFTIHIDEYDYLDGTHVEETVTYLVIEKGTYTLDDGSQIEAGLFDTNSTSHVSYTFTDEFTKAPVLLTSIVTCNESETVVGRVRRVTSSSFEYKLQEQEANSNSHATETVAYLAWTPGSGLTNGLHFEVGVTPDKVTHESYSIDLNENFADLPFHFAAMQTTDGGDTSLAKITSARVNDMQVMIEEECSKDPEIKHTSEVVGYLVILPQ